jgi:hypothetical protein
VELAGDGPIPHSLAIELLEAAHTTVIPYDPTYSGVGLRRRGRG